MIIKNSEVLVGIKTLEKFILELLNSKERDYEFNYKIKTGKLILDDLVSLENHLDIHEKEYDSLSEITDYGESLIEYIEKDKEIVNLLKYFQQAIKEFEKLC